MGLKDINWARLNAAQTAIRPQTILADGDLTGTPFAMAGKKGSLLVALLSLGVMPNGSSGRLLVEMTSDISDDNAWEPLLTNDNVSIGKKGQTSGDINVIQLQFGFGQGTIHDGQVFPATVDLDYVPKEATHIRFVIGNTSNVEYSVSVAMIESNLYTNVSGDMSTLDGYFNLQRNSFQLS